MLYDLFISYAHADNASGQVRELRDAILADFRTFAGRELRIFFDEDEIPSMADWEARIGRGLRESRLFLAVLSPTYFSRPYCRREWEEYVRYEAMRQCLGEGVAPVYFIELPGTDAGEDSVTARWIDELRKRQWCELLEWHREGKRALERAHVAARLEQLRTEIKERLDRSDLAQASPTQVDRHNPQFVGRVEELWRLRKALNEQGSVGVVGHATAIHGLGGMGKTELALAYSHSFAWDYPGGRWQIPCDGVESLDLALRYLAGPLMIAFTEQEQRDTRLAAERVLAELRRRPRTLLLLDNVTHPALIAPDALKRLPPPGQIHLLVTTRLGHAQLPGSPHDNVFLPVDELPDDDALALVRSHQPANRLDAEEEAAASELVRLLGGFTLAVETAAIYLGRHPEPGAIAAYAERLRRDLLTTSGAEVGVRHSALIESTLTTTLESLPAEARQLLLLAALLPPDQIPLPWLCAVAAPGFSNYSGSDEAGREAVCAELVSLRLLVPAGQERDGPIVRMHRLAQEVVLRREGGTVSIPDVAADTPSPGVKTWWRRVLATLRPAPPARPRTAATRPESNLLADTRGNLIAHVLHRGRMLFDTWSSGAGRWELQPLRATSRHWMERGEIAGAELAQSLQTPLQRLQFWADAEPLMRQALEQYRAHFGPQSARVGIACNNLAEILRELGRPREAERLQREAVTLVTEGRPADTQTQVTLVINRGLSLLETGRFAEGEAELRRALSAARKAYGPQHLEVARVLSNLGQAVSNGDRAEEAVALLQEALEIAVAVKGRQDPHTAVCLNNLAGALHTCGRVAEAEPLYREALAIEMACYGADHGLTALRQHNLARLLIESGRDTEADPLVREALRVARKALPKGHPQRAAALMAAAYLERGAGRSTEAAALLKEMLESLAYWREENQQDHPMLGEGIAAYQDVLYSLGHDEAAVRRLVSDALSVG